MHIRSAIPSDASDIAHVHVESSRSTYKGILPDEVLLAYSYERRTAYWTSVLGNAKSTEFVLVAENDQGQIVGFVSGGPIREQISPFTGEIYTLYILASVQRQGIGHRLMTSAMHQLVKQGMREIIVWVLADNPACAFYEALGGQLIQEKSLHRGDKILLERAYGWDDVSSSKN